ncbi:DUF1836 domain-containing protein [Bacillus paralicheniformis]|uniref:DUF1836 domain-containing protein n=1 Tax=Bacillus paralicheniformis TaxID=1648923 RepID=UPI0005B57D97|nr:DUF1836 domain-containing protein [Bacillus paralicheniformis]AJO17781.1 hypothetical protein SC10_B2orf02365 [Bacillus paralicheniformis]MCR2017172.1 DUF1836 domain-containing protein [Bacillus paralicheniformis]TWM07896.1 hypothetical protein CHCC15136_1890 [Bacillus paralicheniformis]TWM41656.1 hypothetical protein CHCC14817_2686 [Bacillus paralicheniformis]TWN65146.1 hypothetical protein CHCC12620_0845 [Bacillus paralicheniformis]
MKPFKLTRLEMAKLMYALKGQLDVSPLAILLRSADLAHDEPEDNLDIPEFIVRYERKKPKTEHGLSTNEIVELGNLCELTSLKSTAIQNWIKRDIKDLMGHPELGKKYSIDQAVILLIVRDLKSVYDFETIRPILTTVFNTITDRSDDVVSPLRFYEGYARVLDYVYRIKDYTLNESALEKIVIKQTGQLRGFYQDLADPEWNKVRDITAVTVLSVIASHIQATAHSMIDSVFLKYGMK